MDKIICVEGYKAFRGVMLWTPGNPAYPPEEIFGDWLYKPDADCWYCKGRSYPASTCKVLPQKGTSRDLALAMLAGARAIEVSRRFDGASYVRDPFGENGGTMELPYYNAAKMLREQGERMLEQLREG